MLRLFGTWAIIVLAFFIQIHQNQKLQAFGKVSISEIDPESSKKFDPFFYKLISLGHVPTLVDALWIQSLGDDQWRKIKVGEHPFIYYDLDLATTLDPAYFNAYIHGASLISVFYDDGAGARDLLLKAEKFRDFDLPTYPEKFRERYWENPWRVPLLLAYVYLFDLDDFPNASIAFRKASQVEGSPPYLQSLSLKTKTLEGQFQVGLRLLAGLLQGADSPVLKEKYKERKFSLFVGQFIYSLDKEFQKFLKQNEFYKKNNTLNASALQKLWKNFADKHQVETVDPWGGRVYINQDGRVATTTPYKKVFKLGY